VRNSRGRPKNTPAAFIVRRHPTVASRPRLLGYQFAEAATKLNIKDVFDAVRPFTHERIKLV